MRRLAWLVALLIIVTPSAAHAQLWSGIIDRSRAVDWSKAGVTGGIPNRTTICQTLSPGATAAQINTALAACPSNQVVFLNAGTYNLTGGITFGGRSNLTLRGAGPDKTILKFSAPDGCGGIRADICIHGTSSVYNNGVPPQNIVDWTAGYAQGTTQITLSSTASLSVGMILILDQLDDTYNPVNNYVTFITSAPPYTQGATVTGRGCCRATMQLVKITAINGNQVTISPGLYWSNWRASQSPQAWWLGTPDQIATMDGVENLTVDNTASVSYANIEFFNADRGWVKNVRSLQGTTSHILIDLAVHIQVQDSYFYGVQSGGGSTSYGIEVLMASDNLLINNIFQHVTTPNQWGAASGTVGAYQFFIDMPYSSPTFMLQGLFPVHEAGSMMNLLEGNVGNGINFDPSHGLSNTNTVLRNYFSGIDPPRTQNTIPVINSAFERFNNYVGNVLGTQGYHINYESSLGPQGVLGVADRSIYEIGFSGSSETNDTMGYDIITVTSMLRWGNFDYVTNTIRWNASEIPVGNAVPPTHTLPPSFFLTARPTWWGTMPWPPIGPDVTGGQDPSGHAYNIPAKLCYLNSLVDPAYGGAGILLFNANACYAAPNTTLPAVPTGLQVF